MSSGPWRAGQHEPEPVRNNEKAQLKSAVNWVHNVLKPPSPDTPQPTTVWVSNVPRDASYDEFLRLVLFGPLFRIKDKFLDGNRFLGLTFFDNATAVAFYREMTENEVALRGERLKFQWGRRIHQRQGAILGSRIGTRAIFIHDVHQLGTREEFHARLARHGPIDRVLFHKNDQSAFVDFLAVNYAVQAAESLRNDGVQVGFAEDRCLSGGRIHATAIRNRVRQVTINDIPPRTSVAELCDHIRGGALERIVFIPHRRVAFVHFLEHSGAAAFWRHAFYHGITVRGQRLGAWMKADKPFLTRPVPHIVASVADGASRCLRVGRVPDRNSNAIRRDFERFGPVERVELIDPSGSPSADPVALVAFLDIEHAIKAARLIGKQPGYEWSGIEFAPDHCAAPLSGAQRTSQSLQAQMANLLNLKPR